MIYGILVVFADVSSVLKVWGCCDDVEEVFSIWVITKHLANSDERRM